MSADNWTTCPRCSINKDTAAAKAQAKADAKYGKVPAQEFMELLAQAEALKEAEMTQTMREDYDIGIGDGEFEVNFRASCSTCGLRYEYKHAEQVTI